MSKELGGSAGFTPRGTDDSRVATGRNSTSAVRAVKPLYDIQCFRHDLLPADTWSARWFGRYGISNRDICRCNHRSAYRGDF